MAIGVISHYYEQFIHLSQCFQKLSAAEASESVYMCERLNHNTPTLHLKQENCPSLLQDPPINVKCYLLRNHLWENTYFWSFGSRMYHLDRYMFIFKHHLFLENICTCLNIIFSRLKYMYMFNIPYL